MTNAPKLHKIRLGDLQYQFSRHAYRLGIFADDSEHHQSNRTEFERFLEHRVQVIQMLVLCRSRISVDTESDRESLGEAVWQEQIENLMCRLGSWNQGLEEIQQEARRVWTKYACVPKAPGDKKWQLRLEKRRRICDRMR